jgi:hypothetical protein
VIAILLDGKDVTGSAQSVVVGQQIALKASLAKGVIIQSQSWSIPGTTVGGYNASLTKGEVVPIDFSRQTNNFYWVDSGNSRQVTYTCTLSNGQSLAASAIFNVAGPSATIVQTALGKVHIYDNRLGLGELTDNKDVGISFSATATQPKGYSGSFQWVQIIDNTEIIAKGKSVHTQRYS